MQVAVPRHMVLAGKEVERELAAVGAAVFRQVVLAVTVAAWEAVSAAVESGHSIGPRCRQLHIRKTHRTGSR